MPMKERNRFLTIILAGTMLACIVGQPLDSAAAQQKEMLVIAEDYSFAAPEETSGGWKMIRLRNRGRDTHHVQLLKLSNGKTAEDFDRTLAADSTQLPHWVVRYGGVNSVMPDEEATVLLDLDPGSYVLICGIPDQQGRPHVVRGMTKSLTVTARDETVPAPRATRTLSMKEFSYSFDQPLTVGPHMIQVKNEGKQAHEVLLLALKPGASVVDFLEFYRPGIPRNPAGRTIGGITGLAPGRQAFLPLQVETGRYGILCFLADPFRRRPHFMDGMWMDIDVPPATSPTNP